MSDGRLNKCKDCTKKDTYENKMKNYEYYRDYEMRRSKLPHRKELNRKKVIQYRALYPERMAIYSAIARAIEKGTLIKPEQCQECGKGGRIEGHHADYSKPLDVEWLCSRCHRLKHTNFFENRNEL